MMLLTVLVASCGAAASPAGTQGSNPAGPAPEGAGILEGLVVAVDGDLSAVNGFTILSDGQRLDFVPTAGLLFDAHGPLSHLRDHMTAGTPVAVEFRQEGNVLMATAVGDAK